MDETPTREGSTRKHITAVQPDQEALTQEALRASESRFRTLAECAPVVVWMTDVDVQATYISRYWFEFTGRDPEQDLGFKWAEALHPDDRERAARDLVEARKSRQPYEGEYRVMRANGEYGWLSAYGVPHFHTSGEYIGHIGTSIDITEHKHRERVSHTVHKTLLLGQEAERRRVSRELHDDIGQRLALLGVALGELQGLAPALSPVLDAKVTALQHDVERLGSDLHRITHNLHPSTVAHLGLAPALRRLCRDFSEQRSIHVEFIDDGSATAIPEDVALALFRVSQECLSNIAKHSGSRDARVTLTAQSGDIHLTIVDHGVGFDVSRLQMGDGLGLISIQERARLLGANLEIRSDLSLGTTITLHVPLSNHEVLGSHRQA